MTTETPISKFSSMAAEEDSLDNSQSEVQKTHVSESESIPATESEKQISGPKSQEEEADSQRTPKKHKKDENGQMLKTISRVEEEGKGKKPFQRTWSCEDELVILESLLFYKRKKGENALVTDKEGVYKFILKSLAPSTSTSISKAKINDKIRKLRRKYLNRVKNHQGNRGDAHEKMCFLLSDEIWGHVKCVEKGSSKGLNEELLCYFKELGIHEHDARRAWNLIDDSQKGFIEIKMKELRNAQMEVSLKKAEFISKLIETMLEASKAEELHI